MNIGMRHKWPDSYRVTQGCLIVVQKPSTKSRHEFHKLPRMILLVFIRVIRGKNINGHSAAFLLPATFSSLHIQAPPGALPL